MVHAVAHIVQVIIQAIVHSVQVITQVIVQVVKVIVHVISHIINVVTHGIVQISQVVHSARSLVRIITCIITRIIFDMAIHIVIRRTPRAKEGEVVVGRTIIVYPAVIPDAQFRKVAVDDVILRVIHVTAVV